MKELKNSLNQGALVLTANNRLQQILRAELSLENHQMDTAYAGRILTVDAWIEQSWLNLQDRAYPPSCRTLLNTSQRLLLWSDIVAECSKHLVANDKALPNIIDGTYKLFYQWRLTKAQLDSDPGLETQYFIEWLKAFEQRLEQQSWIVTEQALERILTAVAHKVLPKAQNIVLVGFDRIYPQLEYLVASAADQWSEWTNKNSAKQSVQRIECSDFIGEIHEAAQWSYRLLTENPAANIGIVIPTLNSRRLQVERIFTEVFALDKILATKPSTSIPINISAGFPLHSSPLVHDALNLLSLVQGTLTTSQIQGLLRSPFWGEGQDGLRDEVLIKLGQSARTQYSQQEFRSLVEKVEKALEDLSDNNFFSFANLLLELRYALKQGETLQAPSEWSHFFCLWLEKFQWPGPRTLNSTEHQEKQKFYQLMDVFSSYDILTNKPTTASVIGPRKITVYQALYMLKQLVQATIFQPQSRSANIQILGTLEAAGLQFDHCWVMGLDEQQWPAPAKPNPLLPIALQKKLNMPRVSATTEKLFAEKLLSRFKHCAKTVIFSSALNADEMPLRVSELIADVKLVPQKTLFHSETYPLHIYLNKLWQSQKLESIHCEQGPEFLNSGAAIRGGIAVIKAQAICPFNAFAIFRLGATAVQKPSLGLTAAERGSLIHEVMSRMWRHLVSQQNLNELSALSLDQAIDEEVESALRPWLSKRSDIMQGRFVELEKQRLKTLTHAALNLDRQRGDFSVMATEHLVTLQLAGMRFDLRIDRIDQLNNGQCLIIDYKTGDINIQGWSGERPSEPQLLLYTTAQQEATNSLPIAGIGLAQLDLKNCRFTGMGDLSLKDQNIPGMFSPEDKADKFPRDWESTKVHWSRVLSNIAQEFLAGHCQRTIYHPQQARYDDELLPFNRLPEAESL